MDFNKLDLIYYSPTGTSKKTIESIANGIGTKLVEHIDLTPQDSVQGNHLIPAGELAAFAVPVYGGRVPSVASQRLQTVKGDGTPAVLVVVYGNRAFARAKTFGEMVKTKIDDVTKPLEIAVPGNRPYRERRPSSPRSPETTVESCTLCGACANVCPTNSVTVSERVETIKETCTACSACVKVCPTAARVWTDEGIMKAAVWLATNFSKRREPEFFL